jgi:hypothetical protein
MRRYLRSERVKLPNVQRIMRGKKRYKYHRPTKTPLPVDVPEDHPSFIDAWTKAEAKSRPRQTKAPGSLGARCEAALQSPGYADYSASYKGVLRRHIDAIAEAYGEAPAAGVKLAHIEADLAKLKPIAARARAKAWRFVFKGKKPNPTDGLKVERAPKTQGHPTWTVQEIAAYRQRWPWGTIQRLAFEVIYWSAAATVDAVKLGPRMVNDGLLTYARGKTTILAHVPWTCELPEFAREWEAERADLLSNLPDAPTFLAVGKRQRSHWSLSNLISEAARDAGVKKSAHGLRKARLTRIAEKKGTAHAIMAWGGHATLSEAERYTKAANLRGLVMGERNANPVDVLNALVNGGETC